MEVNNDPILSALLLAKEFLEQEVENREAGGEPEYVQEARDVLDAILKALGDESN